MSLFYFNAEGLNRFRAALEILKGIEAPTDQDYDGVKALADDETLREIVVANVELPAGPFQDRFDMCSKIFDALSGTSAMERLNPGDSVWAWLSAYYFSDLTSMRNSDGSLRRQLSKEENFPAYIWDGEPRKFYRHRIGHGLYMLNHLGKELSKPMLLSHSGSMSDYCEQTFARIGSYRERAVIEAANSIYFDGRQIIPGSSGERRWGLQHLQREVAQYLVNFELFEVTKDELLALLDKRFRSRAFATWYVAGKAIASFIAINQDTWGSTLLGGSVDSPEEAIAEQIGCTKKDLQGLIKQASVRLSNTAKQKAKSTHWFDDFQSYIAQKRIGAAALAQKMKKLLSASSVDEAADEFLDGLLKLMEKA